MARPEDVQLFRQRLMRATNCIAPDYFLLPVANKEDHPPVHAYRERVYAYELYHQLRVRWPRWHYSLAAEIDKSGHPIFRNMDLQLAKPDLLAHAAGQMEDNLIALEIKPLTPKALRDERVNMRSDFQKLIAFCGDVGRYEQGIFLVFGENLNRVRGYAQEMINEGLDFAKIELWHHSAANSPAASVPWVV
jgi:hypothetical protein